MQPVDPLPEHVGHDRTARRVLVEAVTLFGERGVHGTTMREIAAASGIRAPSIYEHFASKEEIVSELMRIGHDSTIAEFDAALAPVAGASAVTRLETAVDVLVTIHTTRPMLIKVMTDDVHGLAAEVSGTASALRLEMSLRLGQILADGEREGVFTYPNLVTTVAAVHGLFIRIPYWFTPGEQFGMQDLAADYRALVLAMVGAR